MLRIPSISFRSFPLRGSFVKHAPKYPPYNYLHLTQAATESKSYPFGRCSSLKSLSKTTSRDTSTSILTTPVISIKAHDQPLALFQLYFFFFFNNIFMAGLDFAFCWFKNLLRLLLQIQWDYVLIFSLFLFLLLKG